MSGAILDTMCGPARAAVTARPTTSQSTLVRGSIMPRNPTPAPSQGQLPFGLLADPKRCSRCGQEKPLDQFWVRNGVPDGRSYDCKECCHKRKRKHYVKNRETELVRSAANEEKRCLLDPVYREKRRKWRISSELKRKARLIYIAKFPERIRAQQLVQYAVRCGKLLRPDCCARCGKECKPEGSHDDYSKPYNVEWLCKECHFIKDEPMRRARKKG